MPGLSLVAASGGSSLAWVVLWCTDFSFLWLLVWSMGSGAQASVVVVHGLSCSEPVRSSWTRDQTHVSCIGRQILIHCTTREVPGCDIIESAFMIEAQLWAKPSLLHWLGTAPFSVWRF